MNKSSFENSLTWEGNSYKMYLSILNAIPFIFVGGIKKNIYNWIMKNNISVVTEDIIFRAVDAIAPPDLAKNKIKPELEKLRSTI